MTEAVVILALVVFGLTLCLLDARREIREQKRLNARLADVCERLQRLGRQG